MSNLQIKDINVRAVVAETGLVFGEISDIQFELRKLQKNIQESGEQLTEAEVIFFISQILDEVISSGREMKRQKELEAQKQQIQDPSQATSHAPVTSLMEGDK